MSYTEKEAETTTVTYNREAIANKAENIYEAITIIGKRAEQISLEIKQELNQKLDDFAAHNESLDEIFENREQIEVSRFYERLPKPHSYAIEEWEEDEVYFRKIENESDETA